MPNIDNEFPSKYLKASDFDEDGTVMTIASYARETIKNREGAMEAKPILYFRGNDKGLILNKTNAAKLTKLFQSADTDDWIDQPVKLYATEVQFGADQVQAIRIKQAALPGKKTNPNMPRPPASAASNIEDGDPF
jgi:hypothetical protein